YSHGFLSPYPLIKTDARVDYGIEYIADKGRDNHKDSGYEQNGHNDRPIVATEGIDEQPPHTGVIEDRLGQDGAAENARNLEHHDGDERDEGIAGGVLGDDGPLAQTLGPRRAHVVLAQYLEHGGAHEPAPARQVEQGQYRHRQEEMDGAIGKGIGYDAQHILDAARRYPGSEDVARREIG